MIADKEKEWIEKEDPMYRKQILKALREDEGIKKFLSSKKNKCSKCGEKYKLTGYTNMAGMVTGLIFHCIKHRKNPHGTIVPLTSKEQFFTGTLLMN